MPQGSRRTCSVEGCDRPHKAHGLCGRHYFRHRYATDEEFRERCKARQRSARIRKMQNARRRERQRTDPVFQARDAARAKAYRAKNPGRHTRYCRERYQRDPDYRRRVLDGRGSGAYRRWRGTLVLEQGFACALCGDTLPAATAHVDHIVPRSKGGGDEKANLQATCPRCNRLKGDRIL